MGFISLYLYFHIEARVEDSAKKVETKGGADATIYVWFKVWIYKRRRKKKHQEEDDGQKKKVESITVNNEDKHEKTM